MKVHISFVGGQPAPVYHGIVATQPDYVVLAHSPNTIDVMNRVKEILSIPVETIPLHPTDANAILSTAQRLAEQYSHDDITVNISSGLKSWSHLFGITFQPLPNAHVVYMDQNNILWDYKTMTSRDDYQFDMDILFKLYGNPLNNYRPFSSYTPDDNASVKTIESLRKHNYTVFNSLTTVLTREQENKLDHPSGIFLASDGCSSVEWDRKGNWARVVLNNKKWGIKEEVIQSPNAISLLFHCGWFEYKVARMLSHWNHAKEIRLNCNFPLRQSKTAKGGTTKNEIDIIVNTGRKLLFVECKTNISSSLDIDKFRNAVNNYGGMGSKALFVTDNKMTDLQKEKCKDSNIIPFSFTESDPDKEQALQKILNKQLMNINA